ncbi:MAG: hypothetical protein EZS28_017741 [Streblomastix strix]|uniref:Uncharacterized protein n=1 Tax=Streblomastix strix TaxID=222440 RepID=A0A5J4VVZ4_9EUKA|nr:MAG: hypothetical protein EZS28_017741 [Streblomastix strix]
MSIAPMDTLQSPVLDSLLSASAILDVDALNQTWKNEQTQIRPPIPLLPAVLKNIREEEIEAMIIAPHCQARYGTQNWQTRMFNLLCLA